MNASASEEGVGPQDLFENETARSLLDQLLTDSRLYTQSKDYKALLDFVVRLRNFAAVRRSPAAPCSPYSVCRAASQSAADRAMTGRFRSRTGLAGRRPLRKRSRSCPAPFTRPV